jgi:hypothetical protein
LLEGSPWALLEELGTARGIRQLGKLVHLANERFERRFTLGRL